MQSCCGSQTYYFSFSSTLNNILFADINKFLSRGILDEANNKLQFNTAFDENSNIYVYDEESKKKIDLILQNLNYSDDEKELINAVLCDLFGKKSADFYKTNQNSISKIYYTDVYIRNNIAGARYLYHLYNKHFHHLLLLLSQKILMHHQIQAFKFQMN